MDRRLAGAPSTEPGPLGIFSDARNRERVGPRSHHVTDLELAIHKIMS